MYTNGGHGCSFFLHLIAGHPKAAVTLGLFGLVSLLSTPLGPGSYPGVRSSLAKIESHLEGACPNAEELVVRARTTAETESHLSDAGIRFVLEKGPECRDLEAVQVRKDAEVYRIVRFLYYLDQESRFCAQESAGPHR